MKIKQFIKKTLASVGLVHPSLGVKTSQENKAAILLKQKDSSIKIFVETGTHAGWMIDKIGDKFERVYSIELDDSLFSAAAERFKDKRNVRLYHGDSAILINDILKDLDDRAVFWLDAHGSGEITADNAPVVKELESIFAHPLKSHLIFIDDARHFDRKTIYKIKQITKTNHYNFLIEDGVFELTPKHAN